MPREGAFSAEHLVVSDLAWVVVQPHLHTPATFPGGVASPCLANTVVRPSRVVAAARGHGILFCAPGALGMLRLAPARRGERAGLPHLPAPLPPPCLCRHCGQGCRPGCGHGHGHGLPGLPRRPHLLGRPGGSRCAGDGGWGVGGAAVGHSGGASFLRGGATCCASVLLWGCWPVASVDDVQRVTPCHVPRFLPPTCLKHTYASLLPPCCRPHLQAARQLGAAVPRHAFGGLLQALRLPAGLRTQRHQAVGGQACRCTPLRRTQASADPATAAPTHGPTRQHREQPNVAVSERQVLSPDFSNCQFTLHAFLTSELLQVDEEN